VNVRITNFTISKTLTIALVVVALAIVGYVWLVKSISYSNGERVGYIQKISRKGWFCKTWEGEMVMQSAPGTLPEKFYFTSDTDSLVTEINNSLGKKIVLTYEQHKGLPSSCFGDTEYFAKALKVID
jgi:hypothetical protein